MRLTARRSPGLLLLLVVGDLVALSASHFVTRWLRIALNEVFPRTFTSYHLDLLFPPMSMVIPLWLVTFGLVGSYHVLGKRGARPLVFETTKAVSVAMALQIVGLFFFTRRVYSRSLFLLFWLVSGALVVGARAIVLSTARQLKARGLSGQRVVVVGTGPLARVVAGKLEKRSEARYRFIGYIATQTDSAEEAALEGGVLGCLDKAERLLNEHMVDRIVVAEPSLNGVKLTELFEVASRLDIVIERVPDVVGLLSGRPTVSDLDGLPLVALRPETLTRADEVVKRLTDLVAGGLLTVGLVPLGLLIALAIKLDSTGPAFFIQRRVGRGGKHFNVIKFRSMFVESEARRRELQARNEADGHIFKMRRDPRVTRVGGFLRRWSLDELPQLINVVRGEMSLVGPRPLPSDDLPTEPGETPHSLWVERRRTVAPGVTGLWQVSGRSALPFEAMVRLDLFYVENWSLGLDAQILWRTIPVILKGKGAY